MMEEEEVLDNIFIQELADELDRRDDKDNQNNQNKGNANH